MADNLRIPHAPAAAGRSARLGMGMIIHLFALAHALTAVLTRIFDYHDDIPLTVLTISLLIIIALRRKQSIALTALIIPIVTLTGYLTGMWLGQRLQQLTGAPMAASALTTFVLTECFGWAVYLLTPDRAGSVSALEHDDQEQTRRLIIVAACVVLLLRITYSLLFQMPYFRLHGNIYEQFGILFSNTFATLMLLCGVVLCAMLPQQHYFDHPLPLRRLLLLGLGACILLFPLLPTVIVYFDFPRMRPEFDRAAFDRYAFAGLYAVALLAMIIAYLAAMLVRYAVNSRRVIRSERSEKQSEQYKYAKLKQQISPHFLFNSLNILDSLVQSGENERAASYIRKLAALYRYILKTESEPLVLLSEELGFTEMYVDLLQERFIDGLVVDYRVPPEARRLHIVPCGLQMLIENATKHNAVSVASPLHITVSVEEEGVVVANNLQPRISTQPSSRLGLQNIDRQYRNIAGRGIEVRRTEQTFSVYLPLL